MAITKENNYPPASLAWFIWGLAAAFYFTGFFQRLAPAVMTDLLMLDFQIGAAALGNFSAFYFYSYVAMQVPTGIITDYWGPRKLLATGALVSALGTFLFALAPNIYIANLGRFLIGGSVAVAWVTMLKLAGAWFPARRFATVTGLALFCGVSGAVAAGVPLRALVNYFSWRPVIFASALITLTLAVIIWLLVRDDPRARGYQSYGETTPLPKASLSNVIGGLWNIFHYRNTWILISVPSGLVGPLTTFSGLWGVPFLTTHYGLTPAQGAAITSTMLIAWALGGPLFGALSDRLEQRKSVYVAGTVISALGWSFVVLFPQMPLYLLIPLIALIGLSSGCMVLGFAFLKESLPPSLSGTAAGVCNACSMLGPMILQPAVGFILDLHWQGATAGGVRIYDLAAYRLGFTLMMIWSFLSVVLILFSTETNCRQVVAREIPPGGYRPTDN